MVGLTLCDEAQPGPRTLVLLRKLDSYTPIPLHTYKGKVGRVYGNEVNWMVGLTERLKRNPGQEP